jgi:hypothetical protein
VELLRKLALQKGVSFVTPRSAAHASEQISWLLALDDAHRDEGDYELRAIREELASGGGAVALIHHEEIGGFGSTAHWR